MSIFDRAGFLIFALIFVSRDFELDTDVSCEESTVSLVRGKFYLLTIDKTLVIAWLT